MRSWKRLLVLVPLAALVVLSGYVLLPYYSIGPGPARDVEPLIRFDGHARYESQGRFVLTSIVFRQLTAFGVLTAWLDPDQAVVRPNALFAPGETAEQEQQRAISQMDQSKLDAASVVLGELTGYPKDHGHGVLVEGIESGCAADGELFPGDRILTIDGTEVNNVRTASRVIDAATPGSSLDFHITVDGAPRDVSLVRGRCGPKNQVLVGVQLINSFPFSITISTGSIGGPSAGLMFALALYDLLTPGDLTGGRTIAGTGEIAPDGTVIPIAGLPEKIVAAADAGASVFLVPKAEMNEAKAALGDRDLRLVPVATFDEALSFLGSGLGSGA